MQLPAKEMNLRKRKRARTSVTLEDDEENRKRGRPRVEKQDESAADRRRTQIRMAQRAYRQRKESTLEDLRKRVSELTNTMELMNRTFADLRDRLSTGASEAQVNDLRAVSVQYDTLMRAVRNPDDELSPPPEANHRLPASAPGANAPLSERRIEPTNVPSWLDQAVLNSLPKQSSPGDVGMGYTLCDEPAYFDIDPQVHAQAVVPALKPPQQTVYDVLTSSLPDDIRIPRQLSPITTYSFQETTFARRLHRACLEAGYYLLLDPTRQPHTYERVFRLSLMGRDKAKLLSALKNILARGPHESLDFWEAPLIHVGGAGTHYPRKDIFGNVQERKSSYNLGLIGPQTLALLENAAKNNLSTDMTVEIAGYEGEWFDPHDVEGYLEERGIHIDPASSYVEAEMTEVASPVESVTMASSSHPSTPPDIEFSTANNTAPYHAEQLAILDMAQVETRKWNDLANMTFTGVGYSDVLTGDWMNFLEPGQGISGIDDTSQATGWESFGASDFMQGSAVATLGATDNFRLPFTKPSTPTTTVQPPRKKNVMIDVSKFVKTLTISGVCLGRTPGYKRRDVDRALALASFEL